MVSSGVWGRAPAGCGAEPREENLALFELFWVQNHEENMRYFWVESYESAATPRPSLAHNPQPEGTSSALAADCCGLLRPLLRRLPLRGCRRACSNACCTPDMRSDAWSDHCKCHCAVAAFFADDGGAAAHACCMPPPRSGGLR